MLSTSQNKIKGLPFEKQISREEAIKSRALDKNEDPHENRFESYNTINTYCSKYPNPSKYPPFDKAVSRDRVDYLEKRHQKILPNYDYNPDLTMIYSKLSL